MAEVHIERLRRLNACPVCQCELLAFRDSNGLYVKKFKCEAVFSAQQDGKKINVLQSCGNASALAARLMTEECKGAAP